MKCYTGSCSDKNIATDMFWIHEELQIRSPSETDTSFPHILQVGVCNLLIMIFKILAATFYAVTLQG